MATLQTEAKECRQFIGGEWIETNGAMFDDLDPYTGEVVAHVPAGTREEAHRAVEAALDAFPQWSQTPPEARQLVFLRAADILERRRDENHERCRENDLAAEAPREHRRRRSDEAEADDRRRREQSARRRGQ